MAANSKQTIVVRVEVEIPTGVVTVRETGPIFEVAGGITIPRGTSPAQVRVSNGIGYICAQGNAKNGDGDGARYVFGKVYPHGATPAAAPPVGTVWALPNASGDYSFDGGDTREIPHAAHNAGGTAQNTLAIWADYGAGTAGNPTYSLYTKDFNGQTNAEGKTDCQLTGSGSGSGMATGSGMASGSGSMKAPREWRVIGMGFKGAARVFNFCALLRLRDDGGLPWSNGGDGEDVPRIELSQLKAGDWQLRFQTSEAEVAYRCPAVAWNQLGDNTLALEGVRPDDAVAPERIEVTPV